MVVLLHPVVLPGELWRTWNLDAAVVLPIITVTVWYARGLQRLWRHAGVGRGVSHEQARCFTAGLIVLAIALVSPLHALGGALFGAHMSQHVLLMCVAAPLLVLGAPLPAFTWALPPEARRGVTRPLVSGTVRRAREVLTRPAPAWLIFALATWAWHAPFLYSRSVTTELVHAAQHASFIISALLFWWAVLSRARRGTAVLYVFATAVHNSILSALLVFSTTTWYDPYAATAPIWGLTALEDQQIGGLIMWIPAGLIYVLAALVLFADWVSDPEPVI